MTLYMRSGELVDQRPWSDAELAEAIRMRRAHIGATLIGRKLKRSRNSVIGALHRAGEPGILKGGGPIGLGKWSFADPPAPRPIPMRFSEQVRG